MRLNRFFRYLLSFFDPKEIIMAIAPKDITFTVNMGKKDWNVDLNGIDWSNLNITNCKMYRPDGQYCFVKFTDILGYLSPQVFEVPDSNGVAGNIATTVRQNSDGGLDVLTGEVNVIGSDGQKTKERRAIRSSISNPDGSPIPAGTKGYSIIHLGVGHTNNMRISGRVECHGIQKDETFSPPEGTMFENLEEYAQITDLPGQGTLLRYLLAQAAQTAQHHSPKYGLLLNYLIKLYGKDTIKKYLAYQKKG